MSQRTTLRSGAYGGNFPQARIEAFARSNNKCQFCGLQHADEAHHWAWPNYPSGEKVQADDLTAVCVTCHELATMIRDWAGRQGANYNDLEIELASLRTFHRKREAFARWFFPDKGPIRLDLYKKAEKFDALAVALGFVIGIAFTLMVWQLT